MWKVNTSLPALVSCVWGGGEGRVGKDRAERFGKKKNMSNGKVHMDLIWCSFLTF